MRTHLLPRILSNLDDERRAGSHPNVTSHGPLYFACLTGDVALHTGPQELQKEPLLLAEGRMRFYPKKCFGNYLLIEKGKKKIIGFPGKG